MDNMDLHRASDADRDPYDEGLVNGKDNGSRFL